MLFTPIKEIVNLKYHLKLILDEQIEKFEELENKSKKLKAVQGMKQLLVQQISSSCEIIKLKIQKEEQRQSKHVQFQKSISLPEESSRSHEDNQSQENNNYDFSTNGQIIIQSPYDSQEQLLSQSQSINSIYQSNLNKNIKTQFINLKDTFPNMSNQSQEERDFSHSQDSLQNTFSNQIDYHQEIQLKQQQQQQPCGQKLNKTDKKGLKGHNYELISPEVDQILNESMDLQTKEQIKKKFLEKYQRKKDNSALIADELRKEYNLSFRTVFLFVGNLINEIEQTCQKKQVIRKRKQNLTKSKSEHHYSRYREEGEHGNDDAELFESENRFQN